MPRQARSVTSKTAGQQLLCLQISGIGDDALVGVLQTCFTALELQHRAADTFKQIERLKTCNHDGTPNFSASEGYPNSPSRCTRARRPGMRRFCYRAC